MKNYTSQFTKNIIIGHMIITTEKINLSTAVFQLDSLLWV